MKKLLLIPAIVLAAFFTSCSDDAESDMATSIIEQADLESEAALESNLEDVDVIVAAGMETIDVSGRLQDDEVIRCAAITHDEENNTLTIDYGDGCEGPRGRVRAGKIIITYDSRKLEPGSFRQATFEDFSVDGVLIEGTRRVENIAASLDENPKFEVSLTGGKMTFEDGTAATRETSHTREWVRATNPLEDETWIEGSASGSRRDGASYSTVITERLVYSRACRGSRVFIPVSGVKEITFGDNVMVVDYGDGECDNIVTVTINGGEPFEKEITPRGRG
ncbi:MAG: hypothetical protein AAF391_07725 [Bacteroidota bacterium]